MDERGLAERAGRCGRNYKVSLLRFCKNECIKLNERVSYFAVANCEVDCEM